ADARSRVSPRRRRRPLRRVSPRRRAPAPRADAGAGGPGAALRAAVRAAVRAATRPHRARARPPTTESDAHRTYAVLGLGPGRRTYFEQVLGVSSGENVSEVPKTPHMW